MVTGYEASIVSMDNHPKDRHVLAAAVHCGADVIVSDNAKHFPASSLARFGMEFLTADRFLERLYHLNPPAFIAVLAEQATGIGWTMQELLSRHVPSLSKLIIPGS